MRRELDSPAPPRARAIGPRSLRPAPLPRLPGAGGAPLVRARRPRPAALRGGGCAARTGYPRPSGHVDAAGSGDRPARSARIACDTSSTATQTDPGCPLDLDVYINANFRPEDLRALRRGMPSPRCCGATPPRSPHTVPNLLDEMRATRVDRALVLPIAFGLPFGDDLSERWLRAIQPSAEAGGRLLPGASVHAARPGGRRQAAALRGAGRAGREAASRRAALLSGRPRGDADLRGVRAARASGRLSRGAGRDRARPTRTSSR